MECSRPPLSLQDHLGSTVMDYGRREVDDPTVMVLVVVPIEDSAEDGARVREGDEAFRHCGAILGRLEERLRVRIVVGDVGSAVALVDPELVE